MLSPPRYAMTRPGTVGVDGSPAGLAGADGGAREAQLRTALARRPDARELPLVVDHFKQLIKTAANEDFPQDPTGQLQRAGHAVKHFARAEMRRFGNDELDRPDLIRYCSGLIARLAPVTYRQFLGCPGRTSRRATHPPHWQRHLLLAFEHAAACEDVGGAVPACYSGVGFGPEPRAAEARGEVLLVDVDRLYHGE